ncbi:Hypothetical protein FKW44_018292, partial [Caligus rogercresseyi]
MYPTLILLVKRTQLWGGTCGVVGSMTTAHAHFFLHSIQVSRRQAIHVEKVQ